MAHQAGFENVVASLGTALTLHQIALITRYTDRIVLAYDVDPAGERAGSLGVTNLTSLIGQLQGDDSGVKLEDVRVARLPDGKDPDEVAARGPGRLEAAVGRGQAARRPRHRPDARPSTTSRRRTGRIGFVEAVIPAIAGDRRPAAPRRGAPARSARCPASRSGSCARSWTGASPPAPGRPAPAIATGREDLVASPDALPIGDILRAVTPVEAELLRLLLVLPDQQLRVADELGPDQLPSTLARELYRTIVLQRAPDDHGVHPPFDRAALLLSLDDETRSLAQAVLAQDRPAPEAREIDRLLLDLEDDRIRERSDYNESALAEAERAGDADVDRPGSWPNAVSDQRHPPVDRPAARRHPIARPADRGRARLTAHLEDTDARRSARQAARGGRPVPTASGQGRPGGGQAGRPAARSWPHRRGRRQR